MPRRAIVDTVVLRYFLFVERVDVLLETLGHPIAVPKIVYDPDEGDVPDAVRSEITNSIAYQRRVAQDRARTEDARADATTKAERLTAVHELHSGGAIEVIALSDDELSIFGRLTSIEGVRGLGLTFALGPGEAACIAVAVTRDWVFASDDNDALTAINAMRSKHPTQRTRRLLQQAARQGVITRRAANELHAEMRRLGFWDHGVPFPG